MRLKQLTPEERAIIEEKGTEAPFSGEYDQHSTAGIYTCRRCGAFLYRSEDKFDAHCGWPSFDQEVLGAVDRTLDADGIRTEITCTRCEAHLGHVFEGEHLTKKNTRHCVNSISLLFVPHQEVVGEQHETAYLGGGCFWCTEATFLQVRGVKKVIPGYAGGTIPHPSYEDVTTGKTGHAEVIEVQFDPTIIAYEGILDVFFATHDPTTINRQGADRGSQYRSIILTTSATQQELAEQYIARLRERQIFSQPIVTEVAPLTEFYPAEEYHHNYYAKNPTAAYCQAVIEPKLSGLRNKLTDYIQV
jgi:peptide methionine sulfoxide reductase msrA/msrB